MTISSFYQVSIANATGAAPEDGFIDNTKITQYIASTGVVPTSLALSETKKRANLRYLFVTQQLGLIANMYLGDIVATGADSITEAATFAFVVEVERGDSVLYTNDELVPGAILTGAAALQRAIARGLNEARSIETSVYDPTTSAAPGNAGGAVNQIQRVVERVETVQVASPYSSLTAAEATVTVTEIVTNP